MALTLNGSNNTIAGLAVGGLPDGIVDADMIATDAVTAPKIGAKAFTSYALIMDQKSQNTQGGEFATGSWVIRDLNTEGYDPDGIVSISSNKFTLAAGNYLIKWSAPNYRISRATSRLYDVTNSTVISPVGNNTMTYDTTGYAQTNTEGSARVSPSGDTEYRIETRCSSTRETNGLGVDCNFQVEIFTTVEIYKEA